MKTLRGRVIRTNILMVVVSTVVVISTSLLLLLFLALRAGEKGGIAEMLEAFGIYWAGGTGPHSGSALPGYWVLWLALTCIIVIVICTALSINLLRHVLVPVTQLRSAAEQVAAGNLDFEMMTCEDKELDELCSSFELIRQKLKENTLRDKIAFDERSLLVANLSHDMRTPITVIKGYTEGLLDGIADTEEKQLQYLHTIYAKTVALENLVDHMTEYSELELGKLQYVFEFMEVTTFLEDISEEYRREIEGAGLTFATDFCNIPMEIVGDRNKLKRVLDNLISNAIKYNKAGGHIKLASQCDGSGVLISVSNTGAKIRPEDLTKIFDGFYRGDAARSEVKGHGLGLAIAKEIVEKHRGKIWMKSGETSDTEVCFYLPLRRE